MKHVENDFFGQAQFEASPASRRSFIERRPASSLCPLSGDRPGSFNVRNWGAKLPLQLNLILPVAVSA